MVPKLFLLAAPWLMVNPSRDPPALKQVTSSRIEKIIKNLVIKCTMNVQANLSIIIRYILMGQKFKNFNKSKFQYQCLKKILFQYAPMAPRQEELEAYKLHKYEAGPIRGQQTLLI